MPDNVSLLQQLANRAKSFHAATGISQSQMARAIGTESSNYNAFLSGKRGLGAESTCLLLQFVALSKSAAIAKFSKPVATSKILNLREEGKGRMQLDNSGWSPGTDGSGSGQDPNDGRTIDDAPDADTTGPVWDQGLIDVLREARGYHRQICRTINSYIQKAKANAGIVTPTGVSQKFSRNRILRFEDGDADDTDDAISNLLSILKSLKQSTRDTVIKAILSAFPSSK